VEAGFDDNTAATNLLSAAAASGYDQYRRLGSVYYINFASKIAKYMQHGDYFDFLETSVTDSTAAATSGTTFWMTLKGMPKGLEVKARLSMYGYTANNATPLGSWMVGDAAHGASRTFTGSTSNWTALSYYPERIECNVWTNTSGQVCAATTTATSTTLVFYQIGWMDPRGKY
jgi:hypothetical protein